jgi:hypothetical protein
MKRVTGIGGIFFKSRDPKSLGAWYKTHLGIDVQDWGGAAFRWKGPDRKFGWVVDPEGNKLELWQPPPGQ